MQAKHKVSKLLHIVKRQFYTERIALSFSNKELHQVDNTLSSRHPPNLLPAFDTCANLPSRFIRHFNNKVEKLRANIASEPIIKTSTHVTHSTIATFTSFEKVSQSTVNDFIFISAHNSCDLDPVLSKLLMECQESILPSLSDLFNTFNLASYHNASNQLLSHQ